MSSSNGAEGNAEVNEVDMDADDGNDEDKVQQHTERIQQEIKMGRTVAFPMSQMEETLPVSKIMSYHQYKHRRC